jgi:hypothetical protein
MVLNRTRRRRWVGGAALLLALALLVGGETVLKGRFGNLQLLVYWMLCFGLTGVAITMAFLDVRALQRQTRKEQRDLFHATLQDISTDAARRPGKTSQGDLGENGKA